MKETYEKQIDDGEMIFTAISTGSFDSFKDAQRAVVMLYVPDMSISRAGISYALEKLDRYYSDRS